MSQENTREHKSEIKPEIKRGEIYYIRRSTIPEVGTEMYSGRPGLIVSNNTMNATAGFVHVVYLRRDISCNGPLHVNLGKIIDKSDSVAACEQVCVVDKSRVRQYVAKADAESMEQVDLALKHSLDLAS